jgi:GTP-binding protein
MKHPLQQAEFVQSVADDAQLPPPGAPEIAFAGRSNAGKSSAINALAGRTRLAFASRTPGRTQQINYFRLRSGALVTDLPGYGYAAVPHALKRHWQAFLGRYVAMRQSLVGLVLIVDARHGLAPPDVTLLSAYLASGRPALLLATKIDKLAGSRRREAAEAVARALASAFPVHARQVAVVPFSATHRIGIEEAEALLGEWLKPFASQLEEKRAPKEKAPRSRGVPRGPKRPSRGRSPRGHPLREESGRRCRPFK